MENYKGSSNFRNFPYNGKQSLLPPKSPFPSISPANVDYCSSSAIGTKGIPKPREGPSFHHRTSSESFLMEEQPSWVEELLNEPETPVRSRHRRSSSDSLAYLDAANACNVGNIVQEAYKVKNINLVRSRGFQDFDQYEDVRQAPFYPEPNSFKRQQDGAWESSLSSLSYPTGLSSESDNILHQSSGSSFAPREPDGVPSTATGKQDQEEFGPHNLKGLAERRDYSLNKSSASESDSKRAKQQFAQRSRVRKLQYIAELERNVQTLQAEGSEVSTELNFLDRQNLILSMENKTLKQRLDNLDQEQVIKYLEQETLEREIRRLRALHQQQLQPPPTHRRTNSRDLDSRFANLSLKHKETNPGRDPVSCPLPT